MLVLGPTGHQLHTYQRVGLCESIIVSQTMLPQAYGGDQPDSFPFSRNSYLDGRDYYNHFSRISHGR
jgi:hypothetical protein